MSATAITILDLLLRYGPTAVSMAQKLTKDIQEGRGDKPLTPEDWAELARLSQQSSADIYARMGITPPK